ncbi:MAG: glycosyltransferase, partial [Lachnospiraceae bacterium]|nr:glycosyltransferase [Lachnospiraceae bacterium]
LVAGRGFDSMRRHEVGVFELDQARALQQAGHDVRFAAIDTRSIRRLRPAGCREYTLGDIRILYSSVPFGAWPAELSEHAQRFAAGLIWDRLDRESWHPDIVHSHFGTAMLEKAGQHRSAAVYTEHYSKANQDSVSAAELAREKRACFLADRIICVSRPLADRLSQRHSVNVTVVPNIVDSAFSSGAPACPGRDGGFRFISAGSLIRRKGYDVLLRAFARVLRICGTDVKLTIIGEGEEHGALFSLTRSLDISGSVDFAGRLDRFSMVELYRGADAFVLASRQETFGVVYIEAMAMGLPVIATSCGGPEDFVDGSNGFLVPVEDETALTDAMVKMIAGRAGFNSTEIARKARADFSPEAVAARLTTLYEEVKEC